MANDILYCKSCTKCKQAKPASEFSKSKGKLRSACKSCDKAYYQANADKKSEYRAAYYLANTEKVRERNIAWQSLNPERYKLAVSQWHDKNKEQVSEYKRDWSLIVICLSLCSVLSVKNMPYKGFLFSSMIKFSVPFN